MFYERMFLFLQIFRQRGEMHVAGCIPAPLVAHGGIMPARGVDIGMAQRIRHQIDVLRFMIQPRGIRAAQLVRAHALFQRNGHGAILLDHDLNGALGYAPALQG